MEAEMKISVHMGYTNDLKIHPDSMDKLGLEEFSKWYRQAYLRGLGRMSAAEKQQWDSVYNPVIDQFMQSLPSGDSLLSWKYQRYLQDYLATIKSVDDNVGRLLDFLEESGLAENTIVVYTSDQGFYLGEHGWFDKRFMYEESFRTPLIIRWPEHMAKGSVNTDLVQNLDFAPTFLEAAGIAVPSDLQGQSLLPLLTGSGIYNRDALYYHYYEYPGIHAVKRHYGVRTARYKLIHFYHDIDEWELYDLATDPDELNNVYDNPAYAGTRDSLHLKLTELMKQCGDSTQVPPKS
jgi:arylsulfatase A-like enzyme